MNAISAVCLSRSEDSRHQLQPSSSGIYSSRSSTCLSLVSASIPPSVLPPGFGNVNYNEFFLAGILAHGQFCHRLHTSWSFFSLTATTASSTRCSPIP